MLKISKRLKPQDFNINKKTQLRFLDNTGIFKVYYPVDDTQSEPESDKWWTANYIEANLILYNLLPPTKPIHCLYIENISKYFPNFFPEFKNDEMLMINIDSKSKLMIIYSKGKSFKDHRITYLKVSEFNNYNSWLFEKIYDDNNYLIYPEEMKIPKITYLNLYENDFGITCEYGFEIPRPMTYHKSRTILKNSGLKIERYECSYVKIISDAYTIDYSIPTYDDEYRTRDGKLKASFFDIFIKNLNEKCRNIQISNIIDINNILYCNILSTTINCPLTPKLLYKLIHYLFDNEMAFSLMKKHFNLKENSTTFLYYVPEKISLDEKSCHTLYYETTTVENLFDDENWYECCGGNTQIARYTIVDITFPDSDTAIFRKRKRNSEYANYDFPESTEYIIVKNN